MSKIYKECPSCRGYGEVMERNPSWDPAATPYVEGCSRCNGEGKIVVRKEALK